MQARQVRKARKPGCDLRTTFRQLHILWIGLLWLPMARIRYGVKQAKQATQAKQARKERKSSKASKAKQHKQSKQSKQSKQCKESKQRKQRFFRCCC